MNDPYTPIIEELRADCEIRGLTRESLRGYISNVKAYSRFLQLRNVKFEDATKQDVIDFISYLRKERNAKATTLRQYFAALNCLYDFLLFNERILSNIVPSIRKRYLTRYMKKDGNGKRRKTLTSNEMSDFINSILNPRDKALVTLFVKTGIRRGELITIDLDDIDWSKNSISLKDKRKRTNTIVFFDSECAKVLRQWIGIRETIYVEEGCKALFVGQHGKRLNRNGIYYAITNWAIKKGYFDVNSEDNGDHFSPHNLRHCFTTYLLENGMKREYVQELRGDSHHDAIDIYNHIPEEKLREAYLAAMPQFGL